MNHQPFISIIVPAYNCEPFIEDTLQSIERQTYPYFECLVINESSTDQTPAIARKHANLDSRIRVFDKPRGGLSSARNYGIQNSQGEYLCFLDADDWWHDSFLKDMISMWQTSPDKDQLCGIFSWSQLVDEQGKKVVGQIAPKPMLYDLNTLLLENIIGNGSCLLLLRKAMEEAGPRFDENIRYCEDWEMWLRMVSRSKYPYFAVCPKHLVSYRIRFNSQTSRTMDVWRDIQRIYERYRTHLGRNFSSIKINGALKLAEVNFRRNNIQSARELFILALKEGLSWNIHWASFFKCLIWYLAGGALHPLRKLWLKLRIKTNPELLKSESSP